MTLVQIERESKVSAILEALDIGYESDYRDRLREHVNKLRDSTLDLFPGIIELHRSGVQQYKALYTLFDGEHSEQMIREFLFCRPLILERNPRHHLLVKVLAGLRRLDRFKGLQQAEKLEGDDLSVPIAFINVTLILHQRCAGEWVYQETDGEHRLAYIKNTDLQELITSHPEAAAAMVEFIKMRLTGDPVLLREYVEETTPLKQGVL